MFNIPFIQIPFGYVLEFFYGFFNNYGIALILFSLAVKLLLLPMSAKSKKSMMKTSRLQPLVKQIELACGDDKQRYQQEVNKLYKEEGVSMFGGCLWSLIPLIILFPLYNVIREPLEYLMHLDSDVISALKEAFEAAIARETKHGRTICVYDVEIKNQKDQLLGTGTFTYFMTDEPLPI